MISDEDANIHRKLYSGIAEWYVRTFYSDFSDLDWLKLFERITPPGQIVADIGCGPGQFASLFRSWNHRVVSADLSERMLEQGRLIDKELAPVVADIGSLPFSDATLGGVLAAYTLEHVRHADIHNVLSGMNRVLQEGGSMGLMVKCGDGFYEFRSSLVKGARGFVQLWGLEELSELLHDCGFETVFSDRKAPVSPEEFNHERGFILARKLRALRVGLNDACSVAG